MGQGNHIIGQVRVGSRINEWVRPGKKIIFENFRIDPFILFFLPSLKDNVNQIETASSSVSHQVKLRFVHVYRKQKLIKNRS